MGAAVLLAGNYLLYLKDGGPLNETLRPLPNKQGISLETIAELRFSDETGKYLDVYRFEEIRSIVLHYRFSGRCLAFQSKWR